MPIGYSIKAERILGSVLDNAGIPTDELGMTLVEFVDIMSGLHTPQRWRERLIVRSAPPAASERHAILDSRP